jgi:hypothetical protein
MGSFDDLEQDTSSLTRLADSKQEVPLNDPTKGNGRVVMYLRDEKKMLKFFVGQQQSFLFILFEHDQKYFFALW